MSPEEQLAADSWAFLLRIYAEAGVADACLLLQAKADVDVTFLLVAAFAAAQRGIPLAPADISDMNELCRPWREHIVRPLRGVRVMLKSGPPPAPQMTEALRAQIKTSELAAERLQNDLLAGWLQRRAPAAAHDNAPKHVHRVLGDVVAVFGAVGHDLEETAAAIDTIATAALRVSR